MATYKVVDADKLDADLTSVADTIREKSGFSGKIAFPEDYNSGIRDIYYVAYETGSSGGYNMGYTDGFTAGNDEGYSIGYSEGNQAGYNDGYDDGYEEGAKNSFTPPTSDALDPDELYRTTRPSDWLPLPRPNENEMYLLGQIVDGIDGQLSATIDTSGTCTVEFGTVQDGVFVAKESITPTSGTRFTKILSSANYGDMTNDGRRQYVVKIKGTKVFYIDFLKETDNSPPNLIVDIVTNTTETMATGSTGQTSKTLESLKYIRYVGASYPIWTGTKFANCHSLILISAEATEGSTYNGMDYSFLNCNSLKYVSPAILGNNQNTTAAYAFYYAAIEHISIHAKATNCNRAFTYSKLRRFTKSTLDTSKSTCFWNMFDGCKHLTSVEDLDLSSATDLGNAFLNCCNLQRLTFAGTSTPGGYTIDLSSASLGYTALLQMISSLPTATAAATINITSNPGASELTDAEIAIATAKNWTITR